MTAPKRNPFPLQWPESWPRTPHFRRKRSMFSPRFTEDRDDVLHWLEKRGSRVVITSNLPTRQDGRPYYATTDDPGIAVWWVEKGQERVVACDCWLRADENMRAIAKTLDAMRGLDRWGANEMAERAFAGFAALPPGNLNGAYAHGDVPEGYRPLTWRQIFDVTAFETLAPSDLLAIVKSRYRALVKTAHPDFAGGGHERTAELNDALAAAEKELGAINGG